jgi:hypothetical protein
MPGTHCPFLSELAAAQGSDRQTHAAHIMYVLSHDDNCDLKRAPKHAAMLTSHNFFVPVSLSELRNDSHRRQAQVQKDAEMRFISFFIVAK